MTTFTPFQLSGLWVSHGVSEDCQILVGWQNTDHFPRIVGVEQCTGVLSGTDYLDQLVITPTLMDHLRDLVCEYFEV